MKRSLLAALALLLAATPACTAPPDAEIAAGASAAVSAPIDAYHVVLDGPPAVQSLPRGTDLRSPEAAVRTRARLAEIEAQHAAIEPALREHGAVVVARLSRLANAIQVLCSEESARRIAAMAGVRRVERVPLLSRSLASAVPVLGAPALWTGAPPLLGGGVTIGIVDTGIDYTHADFGGPGTPEDYLANDPATIEPGSFPTAKIAGGWDFAGDAYNPHAGVSTPEPDPDPLDCATPVGEDPSGGHGTHVAGIAAGKGVKEDGATFDGPYLASFAPGFFRVAPGVAPGATLHALKIFGCEGPTAMLAAALERAADPNEDGSFDDRLDVVNASLGSAYGLGSATEREIVAALTGLGTLIVAGAGNDGGSFFATGSPGTYPEVLSVAAIADSQLITVKAAVPDAEPSIYPGVEGAFTKPLDTKVSAELVLADPPLACEPLANAAGVAGKIVLIDRGECLFVLKLTHAFEAGAAGAIVADNVAAALPFQMGGADAVDLPGVMVTQAHGAALKDALANGSVAVELDPARYPGPGGELLAAFSARGPSAVDGRLKPEIAAPGVSIDSAAVGSGAGARRNQGTSLASAMVAGAAALVREAQPDLSPLAVKAALVNATVPLADLAGVPYGTGRIGGGRADVARAAMARVTAAADPTTGEIGVSFGAVVADAPATVSRSFVVANHGADAIGLGATLALTHELPGVTVTIQPAEVDVPAGGAATFELTLSLDPALLGKPGPDPGTPATQGAEGTARHYLSEVSGSVHLVETSGGREDVVVPFNGSVRAAVSRKGASPIVCQPYSKKTSVVADIPLTGGGAHPEPVITAFQLVALDPEHPDAEADPDVAVADLRAVGVATNLATAPSFEEARVFFGVAVTGAWTTPARGPLSLVSIAIDTDMQGGPDFELRVEAWDRERPFRDSLVTRVYDLATGEAVGRRPINIAAPSGAQTYPFYSSVIVLDAVLSEIGVDPESPVFGWTVSTRRPDGVLGGDQVKGVLDVKSLLVDTARFGQGGRPLFVGGDFVRTVLPPAVLVDATPVDVLLLHHTNVPGERWEVVNLAPRRPGNLLIEARSAVTVEPGKTAEVKLTVTNTGTEPTPGVVVVGQVLGGELVSAVSEVGACSLDVAPGCALGDLLPGEKATVTATVAPAEGASAVALKAKTTTTLQCETDVLDNVTQAVLGVGTAVTSGPVIEEEPKEEEEEKVAVTAVGGCACRVGGGAGGAGGGAAGGWGAGGLIVAFGLLAARRGRRERRELRERRGGRGGQIGRP